MRLHIWLPVYAMMTVIALTSSAAAQTQADMQNQECAEFKKADNELNKVYKKILTDYKDNKAFLEKLKKAQRAWLAYRDAHLDAIYPEADKSDYGSVYGMCACIAKKKLTEQRTMVLKKWVEGVMEGDVCKGSIQTKETRNEDLPASLSAAIQSYIKEQGDNERPKFDYALTDLDGDGKADAIVLLKSFSWCGSGGCTLLVFKGRHNGFVLISKSTITSEPIRVSSEKAKGWKTLIVHTKYSGDVLMRYNGSKYPLNPSTQPKAAPSQVKTAEIVLQ